MLGDLGDFSKGRGIKREDVSDDGLPCVLYGELYTRYHNYILEVSSRISPEVASTALPLETGNLLFAGSGETAEEIGRCAAYLGSEKAYAGGDIIVLRPWGVDSMYLGHLMNHSSVSAQKARLGQGNAVVHIGVRNLAQIQITLPPLPEQRAIAEALSDVDALINALDTLIAKKQTIKQATMQQLLTGKTRLPGFSGEWVKKRLGDYGIFMSGSVFPLVFQGIQSGRYPFYKVSDFNNEGNGTFMREANNWINEDVRRKLGAATVPAGSILFAKIGAAVFLERKRILSQDSCLDNNMMAFDLIDSHSSRGFFYYLLTSIKLGQFASTTALPSLSGQQIGAIEVRVPSPGEQSAIATVLSDMDAEIAALERRLQKTRAIKQGMMQDLLTGRVRLVETEG